MRSAIEVRNSIYKQRPAASVQLCFYCLVEELEKVLRGFLEVVSNF